MMELDDQSDVHWKQHIGQSLLLFFNQFDHMIRVKPCALSTKCLTCLASTFLLICSFLSQSL
jgi:hypothetical protein